MWTLYWQRWRSSCFISTFSSQLWNKKVYLTQGKITGSEVMRVCSNITEIVAQLLIGHALGSKDVFHESIKQILTKRKHEMTPKVCHNCPKGLLPFHITPHPQLACGRGPLHPRTKDEMDPAVVLKEAPLQKCPCMSQSVDYSFHSQSNVTEKRDCNNWSAYMLLFWHCSYAQVYSSI